MEIENKVNEIKNNANKALESLNNCIKDVRDIEGDVDRLIKRLNVKILAFPNDKLFRLRDERLSNKLITSDLDLEKSFEDFIEEVGCDEVIFREGYWDDRKDKAFDVQYKTHGYMYHKNSYTNLDFGKHIFTSRIELINSVSPLFDKAKSDWISNKELEKIRKKEQLERELDALK
ncbi:MAG TPA: hypothetical protein VN026_08425 [Bacteroidia bacterium]|jgi:hypothetical protein|nr:hypothetical protein [Bacteroidia bacterium]